MPKIEVPENIFYELLGKRMTDDELLDIFPVAKAELDGHDTEGHVIKIELNDTNRPDLWSAAGVARALKTYQSGKIPSYGFFSTKDDEKPSDGRIVIDGLTPGVPSPPGRSRPWRATSWTPPPSPLRSRRARYRLCAFIMRQREPL